MTVLLLNMLLFTGYTMVEHQWRIHCYAPALIGSGIKRCFCMTSVWRLSVCLSVAYIRPKSRTERQEDQIWHRGRPRHTWLADHFQGQKVNGQGHQAALLSAALMRKAAAAVSVGTYSAWESTATLRLLGGARGVWAPTGEDRGGAILCRHAHSPSGYHVVLR